MSTTVNLNKARKARARADKKAKADENAFAFGRTKAQKNAEKAQAELGNRKLDGHKRER